MVSAHCVIRAVSAETSPTVRPYGVNSARKAVDGAQCDHEHRLVEAGIVRFGKGE